MGTYPSPQNVGDIRRSLEEYGDEVAAVIEKPGGGYAAINVVEGQQVSGQPAVVFWSADL